MHNRKFGNSQFELYGEYLHIYDELTEIVMEDHTEYEGELYVLKTDLSLQIISNNFNTILEMLRKIKEQKRVCEHTRELARVYLESTDYLARKCIESGDVFSERYPDVKILSDLARTIVGEGWK